MSKGPSEMTTTSSSAPPGYVQDAQRNLIDLGQAMTRQQALTPAYTVQGLNPDQLQAFDYARQFASDAFNPRNATAAQVNATGYTAPQIDANEVTSAANPFTQAVVNSTMRNLRDQYNQTNADIGARAAAAGSYGGSREAVQRALLNKNMGDTAASTIANLETQGYGQGLQTALQNAQMRNQAAQFGAQAQNAAAAANAQAQNTTGNDAFSRRMTALQALLNTGQQQQQFGQTALSAPQSAFNQLMQAVATTAQGAGQNTTQTQPVQDNTMGNILGILSIGKFLMCDHNLKRNVRKLFVHGPTGLTIYAYRYLLDDEDSIGPMAHEVEAKFPGSTKIINGYRVIDMGAVDRMAA